MRNKLILTVVIIAISTALFAQAQGQNQTTHTEFIWKVGAGHADYPGRVGLDMSFNYMLNPDPIFAFGLEGDFFWVTKKQKFVKTEIGNGDEVITTPDSKTIDLYTFPFFVNGQIRLPFVRDIIHIEPAITIGLGFAFMFGDNGPHGAFPALQGIGSLYFNPIKDSNADFVIDFGYRYLPFSRGDRDMSGFVSRLGVKVRI
jgi:hypothetical protein